MQQEEYLFNSGDFVVYPARGVGQVKGVKSESVCGQNLDVVIVTFDKDKATVKIPLTNAKSKGSLRQISSTSTMDSAVKVLKSKAKIKRVQWSRRSQEYTDKIKSGDPIALAEVIRDLYKDPSKNEQTYSERQIYDQALGLFAPEYALVNKCSEADATQQLNSILQNRASVE